MINNTIENSKDLKLAHDKGVSDAKEKVKRYGGQMFKYKLRDNSYRNKTGSFGKKLKATWHNAFIGKRGK